MRELTHALTHPETARAALTALHGINETPVVEALVELLARPHTILCAAAVAALDACEHPLVVGALNQALDSPLVPVRLEAVSALRRRSVTSVAPRLVHLLREDASSLVRRATLQALAGHPGPDRWYVLTGADDPHWRVRNALIGVLRTWGQTAADRDEILDRLEARAADRRVQGVRDYLKATWSGDWTAPAQDDPPSPAWPWWDPDPAVLLYNLEQMSDRGTHCEALVTLLGHEDERVVRLAVETLRRHGQPEHLVAALSWLDDRRHGAGDAVEDLLRRLELDRIEDAARLILHATEPSPAQLAWSIDQVGIAFPPEEEKAALETLLRTASKRPTVVRRALARLAGRWSSEQSQRYLRLCVQDIDASVQAEALAALPGTNLEPALLGRLLASREWAVRAGAVRLAGRCEKSRLVSVVADPDSRVRLALAEVLRERHGEESTLLAQLQRDPHPLVRAAALTPAVAADLLAAPERETSWHVLHTTARMCRVPPWRLEPDPPWQPPISPAVATESIHLTPGAPPHARRLGRDGLLVAPLGISGHYGLPVEGFARAVEAGVNLLFWEPNYQTLTAFSTRLTPSLRRELHFIAGTFEASPQRVRKDVERALRTLQIERLALFLIFWVRGWTRLNDELGSLLDRLHEEGKVGMYSLSTHNRTLAVEAIEAGWNPVMVRHSAAHRAAEQHVFPRAVQAGTSVITFNNLCYGRVLRPRGEHPAPSPADCYRFSLAQPGVTVCLSAPATLEQLQVNLNVLRDPTLSPDRRAALEELGADLYREELLFRRLVRSR